MDSHSDSVADVVFVIEGTAVNGAYINDIKSNYLVSILEYFSHNLFEEREYIISERTASLYGIVMCRTAQATPNNSVITLGPFSSPQKVLRAIEQLDFSGGKSESNANLAEGLATALTCFDDLKEIRRDSPVQRHCILICNSSPYAMPVLECYQYENQTVEQLASIFHEKKINFSIISPRKIPILLKLFTKAGGDLTLTTKNYCKDVRHLVLLKGFNLKERPISPSCHQLAVNASPINPLPDTLENNNPIMNTNQQTMQNQPTHNQHAPQYQNTAQGGIPANYNPNPQVSRWLFPQQQQRACINPSAPNQQNALQNPNSALISQLSGQTNQANNQMVMQQQQQQQQQNLRLQIMNQQHQPQQQISNVQQQNSPNQHASPQQVVTTEPGETRDRQKIWTGVLEWTEKTKPDQTKVSRQIPCSVTANIKDGESEIKAENWPPRLIMQLMPKHLVGNIGGQYLKDSKMVVFRPNPCEALDVLSKTMNQGVAGCVHFTTSSSSPSCDIKILILLYTAEKKTFLGFIPNNQTMFVDRLRKIIQQKQGMTQTSVSNVHQPIATGNVMTNPHQAPPQPPKTMQMDSNIQMQDQQHYSGYSQMPLRLSENMPNMQQNEYMINISQQQRAMTNIVPQQNMQGAAGPGPRIVRPVMSNNPGIRHLLQQQTAQSNQFRSGMGVMHNTNMANPQVTNRGNAFDDSNFDFI